MNALSQFSTEQLVNELARRKAPLQRSKTKDWCGQCLNFTPWTGPSGSLPAHFNPCSKGHTMKFHAPDTYPDDQYGFHKSACKDRKKVSQP